MADTDEDGNLSLSISDGGLVVGHTSRQTRALPDWTETAYRLWCRGQRNMTQLANMIKQQYGLPTLSNDALKRNLEDFATVVQMATRTDTVAAGTEYKMGLEEVMGELWQLAMRPGTSGKERISAYTQIANCLEQLAALNGVRTRATVKEVSEESRKLILSLRSVSSREELQEVSAELSIDENAVTD